MVIAVDFDGTIVEHEYPAIGRPIPFAIETLLQLQKDNHKLILWTVREGHCCRRPWITVQKEDSIFTPKMPISRVRTERKPPESWEPIFLRRPKSWRLAGWGVIYNAVNATVNKGKALQIMAGSSAMPEPKKKRGLFGRR